MTCPICGADPMTPDCNQANCRPMPEPIEDELDLNKHKKKGNV